MRLYFNSSKLRRHDYGVFGIVPLFPYLGLRRQKTFLDHTTIVDQSVETQFPIRHFQPFLPGWPIFFAHFSEVICAIISGIFSSKQKWEKKIGIKSIAWYTNNSVIWLI